MKTIGYILLSIVAVIWVVGILIGLIAAFPAGIVGLMAFVGMGCLFIHVITSRLHNQEDDFYDKNVKL